MVLESIKEEQGASDSQVCPFLPPPLSLTGGACMERGVTSRGESCLHSLCLLEIGFCFREGKEGIVKLARQRLLNVLPLDARLWMDSPRTS